MLGPDGNAVVDAGASALAEAAGASNDVGGAVAAAECESMAHFGNAVGPLRRSRGVTARPNASRERRRGRGRPNVLHARPRASRSSDAAQHHVVERRGGGGEPHKSARGRCTHPKKRAPITRHPLARAVAPKLDTQATFCRDLNPTSPHHIRRCVNTHLCNAASNFSWQVPVGCTVDHNPTFAAPL